MLDHQSLLSARHSINTKNLLNEGFSNFAKFIAFSSAALFTRNTILQNFVRNETSKKYYINLPQIQMKIALNNFIFTRFYIRILLRIFIFCLFFIRFIARNMRNMHIISTNMRNCNCIQNLSNPPRIGSSISYLFSLIFQLIQL